MPRFVNVTCPYAFNRQATYLQHDKIDSPTTGNSSMHHRREQRSTAEGFGFNGYQKPCHVALSAARQGLPREDSGKFICWLFRTGASGATTISYGFSEGSSEAWRVPSVEA